MSTKKRMDLFYESVANRAPFPSLNPPTLVAVDGDVSEATDTVRSYYGDGMPWPGYWAFETDQIFVFGDPKQCELDFRERHDSSYVSPRYLNEIVSSFQSLQQSIRVGRGHMVETSVIDFWLNFHADNNRLYITYIQVRPCIQRQGLLTIYLFIVIEACHARGLTGLYVKEALPFTQRLLSRYGFKNTEKTDYRLTDGVDKEDMLLSHEGMDNALEALRKTRAVGKLHSLSFLKNQIQSNWRVDESGASCLDRQERWVADLVSLKDRYFRYPPYPDPDHLYYLDPIDFPTVDELADPEYVQSQFPKPNTPPPRYAPGQQADSD
jgi:hypothetical protein